MSCIRKEDGSISVLKLIGLAVVVSIVFSVIGTIAGTVIGTIIKEKKGIGELNKED